MSNFLDENFTLYAGVIQVLRRGTAEILEEAPRGIFLRDTVSNTFMLASEQAETGISWLKAHEGRGYPLLALFQKEVTDFARDRYSYLPSYLDCYQAVYTGSDAPVSGGSLRIREAAEADMELISGHYHMLSNEDILKNIQRRSIFIGMADGEPVGFVGQHLEGSMGMLEVLPQYRGLGYGTELESFLIAHTLSCGLIPFCQVERDNIISLGLQKKLGLHISQEHMYWLF